jgi:hypothetical protein
MIGNLIALLVIVGGTIAIVATTIYLLIAVVTT